MSAARNPELTQPLTLEARVELANRLFREYHTRCFWHCPHDLVITEDLISLVVNGLRKHGGRRGFVLADRLSPNPDRDVAGGAVINRADDSLRYSDDLDIFHDVAEGVAICAEADAAVLRSAGYAFEWTLRQEGFFRAEVKRGTDRLKLDWAADSPFRFFPVEPDKDFGYSLHPADLAVNKVLALAGRSELRDFLDILYLDNSYLSLGAMVWAACGKDPGYTPALLLDLANRHTCYQDSDLKGEHLARPIDLKDLKTQWLAASERARSLCLRLPAEELGCLYLDSDNKPLTPDPDIVSFSGLTRHRGSVRGVWPRFS